MIERGYADTEIFEDVEPTDYTCPKCKIDLVLGFFLEDGYATDDPNTLYICERGRGRAKMCEIRRCWKCPSCGYSMLVDLDKEIQNVDN